MLSRGALPSSKQKDHVASSTRSAASYTGHCPNCPLPLRPAPHVAGGLHGAGLCYLWDYSASVEAELWQSSTAANHATVKLWEHPSWFSHPQCYKSYCLTWQTPAQPLHRHKSACGLQDSTFPGSRLHLTHKQKQFLNAIDFGWLQKSNTTKGLLLPRVAPVPSQTLP